MRRTSIGGMMGAIAVFAMAWASIRYASGPVGDLVFTATLGVLGVAGLGGLFRRDEARARWAGFALLGGGYFALCYAPGSGPEIRPHLVTSTLLDRVGPIVVHPRVIIWGTGPGTAGLGSSVLACPDDLVPPAMVNQPVLTLINSGFPNPVLWYRMVGSGNTEDFQRVGHGWLSMILGTIGAGLARRFRDRGSPRPAASP